MELSLRIASIITKDDSSEYPERFIGLCDRGHRAISPTVAYGYVLNSEIPHLVSEIQTQPQWLKPISASEWLKLCHYWTYSGQITWRVSSRCIVRCPIVINNIVKVKAICKTTFWEESKNMVVDSKGSKSYSIIKMQ